MTRRFSEESRNRDTSRYRIADLTLDPGRRQVRRGSADVELPKLSFDLLVALAAAAPNTLSTDEIMEQVWAGAVVSPATIAKRIELLRQALGDDSSEPRYIALVRGHGYRLVPDVREMSAGRPGTKWKRVAAIAVTFAVIAVATLFLVQPGEAPPEKSIAVLPFDSLSVNPEDEVFADGLSEELSHALAEIGELKVTGRTSSFYYKGRDEDLRVIGEELGVANLLEGSVRRSGDRLRITAQLINAADGFHLWSETYDRRMDDVLDIQRDIARSVATRLRASLGAGDRHDRTQSSTNPEAYARYLKAVSLSPYGAGPGLAGAQALAESVTELDPGFAPGWNRLAAIHGRRLFFGDDTYEQTPQESMRIIRDAVDRALAIDPQSGEAYATLGGIAWALEGDAMKAAPLVERALLFDPWNLEIVSFAAEFAKFIGRLDEAMLLEELIVDRDPLCVGCRIRLAKSYMFTGRFEDAEREFRTLRATEGKGFLWNLGVVMLHQGRAEEALQSFDQMVDNNYLEYVIVQGRAMALHDLGREGESGAAIEDLIESWGDSYPLEIAQALAYIERTDEAFEWLSKSIADNAIELQTRYPSPLFNKLHVDPRWDALLEQVGRAPAQVEQIPFTLTTVLKES